MEITQFSIEEIKDPTNIMEGKRYEFLLDVEIEDEEDELYTTGGLEIRAIVAHVNDEIRLLNYFITDRTVNELLDFALEEDEEAMITAFCVEQLTAEQGE